MRGGVGDPVVGGSAGVADPLVDGADDAGLLADINVTPLVDVVLVLLLTFMVAAPLLQLGLEVEVPEVTSGAAAPAEAVVVTVGPEGSIAVGERILLLSDAVGEVLAHRRANPAGSVHLRVDRRVPYGTFAVVLDALRAEGVEDVALIVDPLELPGAVDPESTP